MNRDEAVRAALDAASLDALAAAGIEVQAVKITPTGKRRLVRVTVDRSLLGVDLAGQQPITPLTLDELADATRIVDLALDATDVLGSQPYVLEVSSPGVGREIHDLRDFRRNVGRMLTLHFDDPEREPITGRLTQLAASSGQRIEDRAIALLQVNQQRKGQPPGPTQHLEVGLDQVVRATVEVEFNREPPPDSSSVPPIKEK